VVIARTRRLFDTGRPLCDEVSGRLKWELRVTWLGGNRVLDKVQASPNALRERPHLGRADFLLLLRQAAAWH
jgi:hypothetical protein